jgi:hypothetical protein
LDDLYVADSFVGPIDEHMLTFMIAAFEVDNPGMTLDATYLRHIRQFHGGKLRRTWFRTQAGFRRAGRMLNFGSEKTLPPQKHHTHDFLVDDGRLEWSVPWIHGRANFDWVVLRGIFPFCLPYWGDEHPDQLLTSLNYSDLLCLDHNYHGPAAVVLCHFNDASIEYSRCEDSGLSPSEDMDLAKYAEYLAPDLNTFLDSLGLELSDVE